VQAIDKERVSVGQALPDVSNILTQRQKGTKILKYHLGYLFSLCLRVFVVNDFFHDNFTGMQHTNKRPCGKEKPASIRGSRALKSGFSNEVLHRK
jgi:hypothetical protein